MINVKRILFNGLTQTVIDEQFQDEGAVRSMLEGVFKNNNTVAIFETIEFKNGKKFFTLRNGEHKIIVQYSVPGNNETT